MTLAPSYPWPIRPNILKPHSCSACNKISAMIWASNFSSLTNLINSSQTSLLPLRYRAHTYTELLSWRTILRFVGHYTPILWSDWCSDTVSNETVAQIDYFVLNLRRPVLSLSGSMIQMVFEFWIIFGFQSTKTEKFPLNGMPLCPNVITTSIIERTPFIVRCCCSAACLCSLALMSLPGRRVFRKLVVFSSKIWSSSLRVWASRAGAHHLLSSGFWSPLR